MPRIPSSISKCTFYLYPSVADAEAGTNLGGTGFFVGVLSEFTAGREFVVAVTNWHVAVQTGCSIMRVSTLDGNVDIFDIDPSQWEFIPGGHDIAVTHAPVRLDVHDFSFVSQLLFLNQNKVDEYDIGPGENVFMVGRFIDHDGGVTNKPALRFGNISLMPELITQQNGARQPSYCVDSHSRTGFSGSPVFSYRTPGEDLGRLGTIDLTASGKLYFGLLGIHWGQFPENWRIESMPALTEMEKSNLVSDGQVVRGLSGMTCVAPAWSISDVIKKSKLIVQIRNFERAARLSQKVI